MYNDKCKMESVNQRWQSAEVMEHCKISNYKHQISGYQVSGVRCQVSGKKNKTTET